MKPAEYKCLVQNVRQEGRPCVSLISRQFSSGRPVYLMRGNPNKNDVCGRFFNPTQIHKPADARGIADTAQIICGL